MTNKFCIYEIGHCIELYTAFQSKNIKAYADFDKFIYKPGNLD